MEGRKVGKGKNPIITEGHSCGNFAGEKSHNCVINDHQMILSPVLGKPKGKDDKQKTMNSTCSLAVPFQHCQYLAHEVLCGKIP